ncbi:MAG: sigma-70 family RNA polymerase sigma factor [Bryobacteraceae bacterium]
MISKGPGPSWSDEDLVCECRGGSQAAWQVLVDRYKKLVYSIPGKYGLPPEESADVFQAVWTDLYRDLDRLQNAGALRGWLITATARRSLHQKKRLARTAELGNLDVPADSPDAGAIYAETEREQLIRDAVAELPPRCRKIIEMLFFRNPPRPYQELAAELGLAEGSIGFIRGRCLKKLRAILEERGL